MVLRVLTGIPFACAGGVFALWLRGMPFSLPAAVGLIALSGVAVLDGMILVSYVRQLRQRGLKLDDAVQQAAITATAAGANDHVGRQFGLLADGAVDRAWLRVRSGRWRPSSSAASSARW